MDSVCNAKILSMIDETKAGRLFLLLQAAAIKWIDPLFSQRHPGVVLRAIIRGLGPLVRGLQPNDQWNLGAFVDDWVKILNVPTVEPLPPSKRIFIFGCYRGQYTQDLILALLLAWRGHRVVYGYLPKLQSPIKDPLADHPSAVGYLHSVMEGVTSLSKGRVRCVDLSAWSGRANVCDDAYLSAQLRADVVMRVRQEKFDEADPDVKLAMRHYGELGRVSQQIALAYLGDHREAIDLCLIANGASFENGQFCHVAKMLGIPVNTHEKFAFNHVRVITHGDAFFHFSDLDRIWVRRKELGFLDEPMRGYLIGKAWDLLNQRRNSSGNAWGWQYQKGMRAHTVEQLRERLGIEKDQFALVCPNVPFDAGYDGWLRLFPSMREWLVQTVETLLRDSQLHVVVRAHPAETRQGYGREQIAAIIEEAGIHSSRLVLLPGNSDINTYDLMPLCKFASVFASTTGVEIAMHGKPVIAGASVYYARCGITVPMPDRATYFARLADLAAGNKVDGRAHADDAAMLYCIFHYLLQWPFPYDKPSQITAWPLKELPAHPLIRTYIETLDVLSKEVSEYEEALPDLVTCQRIEERWEGALLSSKACGALSIPAGSLAEAVSSSEWIQ